MAYNAADPNAQPAGAGRFRDPSISAQSFFNSSPGLLTSTGALNGTNPILAFAFSDINIGNSFISIMDVTNFNCEEDCSYTYRVEDIIEGHKPTIRRARIRYRDLGLVKVTFTLTGENAVPLTSTVNLGGKADGKIKTAYADFVLTSLAMQLSLFRKAGDGPLSIISVTLEGVEGDGDEL
jgi:hypothetical protein